MNGPTLDGAAPADAPPRPAAPFNAEERLRAIVEHSGDGLVVVQDERFVFVNRRAEQIVRLPREEMMRHGFLHSIHPDDRPLVLERQRRRLAGETVPDRYEIRLLHEGGDITWIEIGVTLVPWDGRLGTLTFFSDITERKQLQEQRRRAEADTRAALDRQRELNELRARFVAMTSHEFRTPLAAILSSAELLRHYGERISAEDRAEVLGRIETSVQRMNAMIDRVLMIGRADAQMLECRPREIDLESLAVTLVQEARAAHPGSACTMTVDVAPERTRGRFDPELLRHALGNLLSNALKYSPGGGLVRLVVAADGARTRFEVHDQGLGIPPDELPHLFESFQRASNTGDIAGTGLGLVIARQAVERHGGHLGVDSEPGRGSCFTVVI